MYELTVRGATLENLASDLMTKYKEFVDAGLIKLTTPVVGTEAAAPEQGIVTPPSPKPKPEEPTPAPGPMPIKSKSEEKRLAVQKKTKKKRGRPRKKPIEGETAEPANKFILDEAAKERKLEMASEAADEQKVSGDISDDDILFPNYDEGGNGDASDTPEEKLRKQQEEAVKRKGGNGHEDDIDDLLEKGVEVEPGPALAPTKGKVKEAAMKLLNYKKAQGEDGLKTLRDVLASYHVAKVAELKPGHWSNFIQKCQSLM